MTLFWPMAKYDDTNGEEQTLFTTDGCMSLTSAIKQIDIWDKAYGFKIIDAWIDVRDTDIEKVEYPKIELERKWIVSAKKYR